MKQPSALLCACTAQCGTTHTAAITAHVRCSLDSREAQPASQTTVQRRWVRETTQQLRYWRTAWYVHRPLRTRTSGSARMDELPLLPPCLAIVADWKYKHSNAMQRTVRSSTPALTWAWGGGGPVAQALLSSGGKQTVRGHGSWAHGRALEAPAAP